MANRERDIVTPVQERSQQSLERMLDAAERLLRERNFDALTIGDVVSAARSSVGSFYARFEDKAALLRAVQDRFYTRIEAEFDAQALAFAESGTLSLAITGLVTGFVHYANENASLMTAFMSQAQVEPEMRARPLRVAQKHYQFFCGVLRRHQHEIRHPDPELAIRFAYSKCVALVQRHVSWLAISEGIGIGGDDLIREVSRAMLAYLRHTDAVTADANTRPANAARSLSSKPAGAMAVRARRERPSD